MTTPIRVTALLGLAQTASNPIRFAAAPQPDDQIRATIILAYSVGIPPSSN